MATTASGSLHTVAFSAEETYGTVPTSPVFTPFRNTGCNLNLSKDALRSEEIVVSRHITAQTSGAKKIGGDLNFELSYGSHDDILQAVMCGTWARTGTKTATTISFAASDNSVSDSGNGFLTAGFRVGDPVAITGAAQSANNKARRVITAVVAGKITFGGTDGDDIVDEAATASVTLNSLTYALKAGTTRRSFTIERKFDDLTKYMRFTGCEFDKMQLQASANAIVKGTFSVIGQDMDTDTAIVDGATYSAASTTVPLCSFRGTLKEGGSVSAAVTEISLNLENGLEALYSIGSQLTAQSAIGLSNVSGQVTCYFQDSALLDKFIDDTESSLEVSFPDVAGNVIKVVIPRLVYSGAPPDVKGPGPITMVMPFQALYSATALTNMTIERTPAA